jgi:hypothetical protein
MIKVWIVRSVAGTGTLHNTVLLLSDPGPLLGGRTFFGLTGPRSVAKTHIVTVTETPYHCVGD